jgi:hypothetical protein
MVTNTKRNTSGGEIEVSRSGARNAIKDGRYFGRVVLSCGSKAEIEISSTALVTTHSPQTRSKLSFKTLIIYLLKAKLKKNTL